MRRFLLTISIACLCGVCLQAQQLSFNIYTPADGLIDARVQKIFQDSRGVLYFLTRDGFCSFDGQRFEHYTATNNQPLSIVNDIMEDADGSLLVSAISGMYRLKQRRLQKDSILSGQIRDPGNFIQCGPGTWVIYSGSGSYIYKDNRLTPVQSPASGNTPTPLQMEQAAGNGHFIAGLVPGHLPDKTVFYNTRTCSAIFPVKNAPVNSLLGFDNEIYLKIAESWKRLDPRSFRESMLITTEPGFAIPPSCRHFFIDRQQNKWLFNQDKTITFIRGSTGESILFNNTNGLPDNVTDIWQDRENNYWLMVPGKGVYKMVQSGIQQWPLLTTPAQTLSMVRNTLCIRSNDNLAILNGSTSLQKKIRVKNGLMQVVAADQKWIAFYNNGQMETEDGTVQTFADFTPGSRQLSALITADADNRLLTAGDFFAVIDRSKVTASTALPYFTDNITAGDDGLYWCFARNGTVQGYQLNAGGLQPAVSYADRSFSARFALHWNKDSFYIGTRSHGVVLVKASRNGYQKLGAFSTADGLSNNFVTGLLKLKNNQLLVSTVTGLDKIIFSGNSNSVEQLFSRIGLFIGVPYMALQNDSTVLALTDNGKLYEVKTGFPQAPLIRPSLFFRSVTVNGGEINTANHTAFPYNRNNFHFSVSAPAFIDEKNIRFIFRLNGENMLPGSPSRSGEASFSNLSPGQYTVDVTAIFPGNEAMRKTISYSFRINKPFWKTTGFIAGFTLLVLLLIYGIFRIQLRRKLQRKQIEMEKEKAIAGERSRIASDMHDDLGAGISTIKYLSQSAPFISPDVQKENNLKIAAQADDLVDKMNDIIWAMNEKNDSLDNLLYYTKAWVAGFAEQHQVAASIVIPAAIPSLILRGEKRQHIFLCIKEAVHNIIKHSGTDRLWLDISLNQRLLRISIRDNGSGFDPSRTISGNGLSNMQKRMKAVSGQFELASENGTTIQFTVPV